MAELKLIEYKKPKNLQDFQEALNIQTQIEFYINRKKQPVSAKIRTHSYFVWCGKYLARGDIIYQQRNHNIVIEDLK